MSWVWEGNADHWWKSGRHNFHQRQLAICRENQWSARRWHDNADAAGKRSHDSQLRVGRDIKLDLADVRADGVSGAVWICERESQWSWKFKTMQWPAYWSNHIFFGAYHHRFHSKHGKGTLWWEARRCARNAGFRVEHRQRHQDTVQLVEHQSTSQRKCIQQEWSSTGETAHTVGSALNGGCSGKHLPNRWTLMTLCFCKNEKGLQKSA